MNTRWCPDWLGIPSAGVVLNLGGEVGDQLGSLCQVVAPDGIVMQRWWNAEEPRQRTRVDRREGREAPVEDGGHVYYGAEVSSTGGNLEVEERVLTGLSRQAEQVCMQRRPGTA